MFSCCTVLPDTKETKLRSSNQEASPSVNKNTGIVFTGIDSILSNIDEVLLVNPTANVIVFGDFNVRHKELIDLVELVDLMNYVVIIFNSQMTLLRWLTFLLGSMTVTLTVMHFWIYLFLLMLVFVLPWLSLHWEILIMLSSQFPLTFQQTQNEIPHFTA